MTAMDALPMAELPTTSINLYLPLSAAKEVGEQPTGSPDKHDRCRTTVVPTDRSRDSKFWSKVYRTDCCWLWTRGRSTTGYGFFWSGGKARKAHRVAYQLTIGPIPAGLDVMHTCDVRECVNPDHLRLGTRGDNQRDMVAKKRHARQDGENNGHSKFRRPQVDEIRRLAASGTRHRDLAEQFGTSVQYVGKIVSGRVWADETTVGRERARRLTEPEALEIRRLRRAGMTLQAIADQFGVTDVCIHKVVTYKTWKHVA